ncbi:MAG TPA: SDR family NAD(P)-dependent oxidoreductase [Gammaproteobacteria bacterium]|jgi:UDP-glucose 4-epimerase|nr:SDR family NAD(P)-dependent oxidoreductase [Gammaproteobacteria bacterium]
MFEDKAILVTGGTGSFGRTVAKHLLSKGCPEIRIFSRDEDKQNTMRIEMNDPAVKFYIGDVRSRSSVDKAMEGVHYVFHAAALKQVPSCEFFPMEAVQTNIVGSMNVLDSAIQHGAKGVVCLGTDKAVYPINAMGMTKALMEKVAQASARDVRDGGTVISCVRYGNVMYSRGSVIPLFVKQIKEGKPLTVTEPGMTRFMLALSDAVDLVEFAFMNAKRGDIFVRKAPACTIGELVESLKRLFKADNPVKVIGMRHGEKLYETLVNAEERLRAEDMGDYYRIRMDDRDLNYAKYFSEGEPKEASTEDYHSHNTRRLVAREIDELILKLPEIRHELALWQAR